VDKVEPLTQCPLAIFGAVPRTRVIVHSNLDTVASRNTGSFAGAGKSETDSVASQWGSRLAGIEVGGDRGWPRSWVTPAAGAGATPDFSTEIAEIDEIAENPRLGRWRVPDRRKSAHQATPPPVGVGATTNSAISSISAISVQKAQAQTKDRPMQESQNPEQIIKKPGLVAMPLVTTIAYFRRSSLHLCARGFVPIASERAEP
jgi:hypothetical protein